MCVQCVCACVRVLCVRACVRACVRVCVCVWVGGCSAGSACMSFSGLNALAKCLDAMPSKHTSTSMRFHVCILLIKQLHCEFA